MDLSDRLARAATRRVAVLLVEVPGWGRVRCAVQSELRARGWREATSAADADALVVCGRPGIELEPCLELVWQQLPGPRARIPVEASTAVGAALDQLLADLLDTGRQRADAVRRPTEQTAADGDNDQDEEGSDSGHGPDHHGHEDHGHDEAREEQSAGEKSFSGSADGSHEGMDQGDRQDGDHADSDQGHGHSQAQDEAHGDRDAAGGDRADGEESSSGSQDGDHGGMDHGGMDMPMPGGIPLAREGPDRDGLDLDELHVPLGPVLPAWPAGLVVECTLHGDLVTAARAHVLTGEASAPGDLDLVHGSPPDRLDRVAQLLAVAGWEAAATAAARLRDRLLFANAPGDIRPEVERLAARVRRSWVLRWSLADVPGVRDRLLDWLAEVHDAVTGAPTAVTGTPVEALGGMVVGQDLAAARLLVAAADVDTAGLVRSGADLS